LDEIIRKRHIISSKELFSNMDKENIKILDARWSLDPKIKSLNIYNKQHLPNALFFDLEFFSNSNSDLPHMLPSKSFFDKEISKIGIETNDKIVIYDQNGYFSSCRIWFMFKIFGHKDVLILDGGMNDWVKNNMLITNKKTEFEVSNYKSKFSFEKIVTKLEIKESFKNNDYMIVDARPKNRFEGVDQEPRKGLKKGNIESSINIPFNAIHDSNGFLLNSKNLKNLFFKENKLENKKVIATCGSGITACNIIFGLSIIDNNNVYLYDGSWAEWGKY
jgi:thiosulfate/3-mercaptopyruvate sulfurtransferase